MIIINTTAGLSQGLILDKKAYSRIPLAKISNEKGKIIPDTYSLLNYTPYPGFQGRITSCVGWSIANALTTYRAYLTGNCHRGNIDDRKYSASFIYNLINKEQNCARGASLIEGLNLIREVGVCYDASFASTKSCDVMPSSAHYKEAASHKLTTYYRRVFSKDKEKIKNTRLQVSKGNPVIVGFSVVPNQRLRGHSIWSPDGNRNGSFGHAMVVVGYESGYFQLMNSYGKSWGDKGFIKISNSDYEKYAQEGYVLEYKAAGKGTEGKLEVESIRLKMSGKVVISAGKYNEGDSLEYQPLSIKYDNLSNSYKLNQQKALHNEFLQLKIEVPKGIHAYLINIDNNNYLSPLWQMEASSKDTIVTLPKAGNSLQFMEEGKEHLCLLFSYQELKDFEQQINKLEVSLINGQSLHAAIQTIYKEKVIPYEKITSHSDKIDFFSLTSQQDGYILPVLIELDISSK